MFHLKISIGEQQVMNKRRIQFYFGAGLISVLSLLLWFGFDLPASISAARHESRQASFASTPEAKVDRDGQKIKKKAQSNDDAENEGVRVKGARPTPPFAIPATVPGKQYAYFIAMGDWGTGSPAQRQVAELMNAKAGRDSLHFVLLLGDNFYEKGVASVDDPQWQKKFERMYDLPFLNVPFFATLGNHDYKKADSPDAQVEYSKRNTKWKMPARFYTFTRTLDRSATIQFFALDTEDIATRKKQAFDQLAWLENELKKSNARWKVVFGHHPIFSNGEQGDTPALKRQVRPLLENYRADFYLCGHDHDRQLLQPVAGVTYIVSGTGAKVGDTAWADNTIFAATDLGFVWVRVAADEFHLQFINKDGEIEFAYTANKPDQKRQGNGQE
jgi:acid phosphatase